MRTNTMSCLIVQKHEENFRAITRRINAANGADREAECAERMKEEVETLLKCAKRNASKAECRHCHILAKNRKDTVKLIMKAQELEREMDRASIQEGEYHGGTANGPSKSSHEPGRYPGAGAR